ncbi:hypothetical protein DFO54_102208 [Erwinia sp. AG740]|nr:hypothetical protein DFO54_102208 [Erwinia sp. AG740]
MALYYRLWLNTLFRRVCWWLSKQIYPSYFKLQVCWLRYSAHQWASPFGPLPAAFKLAYTDLSFTRITYLSKLIGMK